jgi:ribosomal protein S18 acetylase RimI-like enzyme
MYIRKLTELDAEDYWNIRLQALRNSPEAFGSSYEESVTTLLTTVVQRFRNESTAGDNFILGAFEGPLVGIVGFYRNQRIKDQHKGTIWGMYVLPEMRGRGIGKALMSQAIAHASSIPGLLQIHLAVVTAQNAARHLYRSLGFEVYGLEPRALKIGDQFLDEELMILRLN